ncbi:MAG: hypothetical protein SH857_07775 [Chitinophagales bacterium]|nr:hypothetical protein [Chitinophagales bacterium]
MKKAFFTSALAVIITIGFSSCKKDCETCTKQSEPEVEVCEDDYDSNTGYGLAIDALELVGYECK